MACINVCVKARRRRALPAVSAQRAPTMTMSKLSLTRPRGSAATIQALSEQGVARRVQFSGWSVAINASGRCRRICAW